MQKFISWRRVSTKKQKKSGLGLEAQLDIVKYHAEAQGGEIVADYAEAYTGTDLVGCTQLRAAMEHAKRIGATLIIAKTDRFRNAAEALQIYEEMDGKMFFCDCPSQDKMILTIMFAIYEREALNISIRTKQALQVKKAKGERLGRQKGCDCSNASAKSAENRRQAALANEHNRRFYIFVSDWERRNGPLSTKEQYEEIVDLLNRLGYTTSTKLQFTSARFRAMYDKVKKYNYD